MNQRHFTDQLVELMRRSLPKPLLSAQGSQRIRALISTRLERQITDGAGSLFLTEGILSREGAGREMSGESQPGLRPGPSTAVPSTQQVQSAGCFFPPGQAVSGSSPMAEPWLITLQELSLPPQNHADPQMQFAWAEAD